MLLPACTGSGEGVLVTVRFGPDVPTTVLALAVLFAEFGSGADELTETESVITVPFVVVLTTFTTRVNVPLVDPAILTLVQTTFPVVPTPGAEQLQPEGAAIETKVVLVGIGATMVALSAALGPLLVTTCVYVILLPAATGFGVALSVTFISALEATVATFVAVSLRRLASPPPLIVAVFVSVAGAD